MKDPTMNQSVLGVVMYGGLGKGDGKKKIDNGLQGVQTVIRYFIGANIRKETCKKGRRLRRPQSSLE